MKKISLYLEEDIIDWLKKESKKTGVPFSEIIRRSIKKSENKIKVRRQKNVQRNNI